MLTSVVSAKANATYILFKALKCRAKLTLAPERYSNQYFVPKIGICMHALFTMCANCFLTINRSVEDYYKKNR